MEGPLLRLLESFPGVVWVTDDELRWELVTGADLASLDVRPSDVIGRNVAEFIGDDEGARIVVEAHRCALGGEAGEYEWAYKDTLRRGRVEPIRDTAGAVVGVAGVSFDITSQHETDRALAELAAIVSSTGEAIIGKALDGTVTSWNAAAERMYGYSAEEVVGREISL